MSRNRLTCSAAALAAMFAASCSGNGHTPGRGTDGSAAAGGTGGGGSGGSGATGGTGVTGGSGGGAAGEGGSGGTVIPADAALPDARAGDAGGRPAADGGAPPDAPSLAGCTLRWSPTASANGKGAFEGLEMPDLNGVHPGVIHFSTVADHDAFRIDQHIDPPNAIDYDQRAQDRVRCETKGMNAAGTNLQLLEGQSWRISWSLLVPSTLQGSTRFNHIWQMKFVDTGGGSSDGPLLTLDLTRPGGKEQIRLDVFGVASLPGVDFAALHDKWLSTEVTIKIASGTGGSVRWTLSDGATVLGDQQKQGISTWPANAARLRPKWGIYRSLGDTSGSVKTTYILLSDMRAYTCQ
jgi:hypothetical protein